MKDILISLKKKYQNAPSEEERNSIHAQMIYISEKHPQAYLDMMTDTAIRVRTLAIRVKFREELPFLSVSSIAKEYSNRDRTWLSQRLNAYKVNGKPPLFSM